MTDKAKEQACVNCGERPDNHGIAGNVRICKRQMYYAPTLDHPNAIASRTAEILCDGCGKRIDLETQKVYHHACTVAIDTRYSEAERNAAAHTAETPRETPFCNWCEPAGLPLREHHYGTDWREHKPTCCCGGAYAGRIGSFHSPTHCCTQDRPCGAAHPAVTPQEQTEERCALCPHAKHSGMACLERMDNEFGCCQCMSERKPTPEEIAVVRGRADRAAKDASAAEQECVCWTRERRHTVCAPCLAAGCDERGQDCRRGLTRDHPAPTVTHTTTQSAIEDHLAFVALRDLIANSLNCAVCQQLANAPHAPDICERHANEFATMRESLIPPLRAAIAYARTSPAEPSSDTKK